MSLTAISISGPYFIIPDMYMLKTECFLDLYMIYSLFNGKLYIAAFCENVCSYPGLKSETLNFARHLSVCRPRPQLNLVTCR